MPVYKASSIVLRRSDLGETDRILRLLTRESGKISAVAKGARRGASRLSGATELFTHSRMLLAVGKTLDIVSQCEIRESFPALRQDLPSLARATYLCELVDRMIEEREPDPDLFDLLLSALYLLQRARENPDVIVHSFEARLMSERGYRPELQQCVKCGEAMGSGRAAFSPSFGGLLCAAHRFAAEDAIPIARPAIDLFRAMLDAEPSDLISLHPEPRVLREVSRCLRWYIRCRAERDLHSAEFLEMLRMSA